MTDKDKRTDDKPAGDGGASEVQKRTDEQLDRGYRGIEADPTPNENYTVAGVTSGAPTPETDPDYAEDVRKELRNVDKKMNGVADR